MKWNESGFRPPLCTYRQNWARRTSWGWWDDWDDTVLQTQDSKFEPWRSEAEHATSRSRRLPTILTFTRGWGRNIFWFFQTAEIGNRAPRAPAHYDKQYIVDGFWMMGVPLMDPKSHCRIKKTPIGEVQGFSAPNCQLFQKFFKISSEKRPKCSIYVK